VEVRTEIEIARPRAEVAAYASNPDNATNWYENIKTVVWQTPRRLAVGTRLGFVAQFLGRRLAYTVHLRDRGTGAGREIRHAHGAGTVPDGDDLRVGGRR
jgi:hypothetical protein